MSSLPPPPPPPPSPPPPPPAPGPAPVGRLTGGPAPVYPPSCRWGLGDAGVSFVIFFATSIVMGVIAYAAGGADLDEVGLEGAWLPLVVTVPPLAQGVHLWWIARAKGRGLVADFGFSFRWSDVAVGAGLCVVGLIVAGLVGSLVFTLFDQEPSATVAELAEDSQGDGGGLSVWIYVLAVVAATVVPVVEELVYRGLWWSALEKRGMSDVATILLTSTVFAVVHFEPIRFPVLFVLGLALGYGRTRTGRIGPAIVAHMLINGIGMLFLLIELSN